MTTMNRGKEKGSKTAETSFIEGDTNFELEGMGLPYQNYPEAKALELKVSYSKRGRWQVKIFGQGKRTSLVWRRKV